MYIADIRSCKTNWNETTRWRARWSPRPSERRRSFQVALAATLDKKCTYSASRENYASSSARFRVSSRIKPKASLVTARKSSVYREHGNFSANLATQFFFNARGDRSRAGRPAFSGHVSTPICPSIGRFLPPLPSTRLRTFLLSLRSYFVIVTMFRATILFDIFDFNSDWIQRRDSVDYNTVAFE